MYDYGNYNYGTTTTAATSGLLAGFGAYMIVVYAVAILTIVSMWKIFKKAGQPGWAAIIPVYNIIVLLNIVELPIWYIALFFIPFANIYALFKIYIELAHKFGKSTGFGVLTVFFSAICLPILAFGKSNVYNGSTVNNGNMMNSQMNCNVMNNDISSQPIMTQVQDQQNQTLNQIYGNTQQSAMTDINNNQQAVESLNSQPQQKFCTNCGNPVNGQFCTTCGQKIQ